MKYTVIIIIIMIIIISPVILKYWFGIRLGVAMLHGHVGIFSLGW